MTTLHKGRIFISYRRIDTSYAAGRIYDRLVARFGEDAIFMDVDTIEGGLDFAKVLEDAVQSCDALVALIGRQWLNAKDESGNRRLDNPEDFVRIEIATALKRDIRVIPVLVDGIDMPRATELPENLKLLARRNALQVNHHSFNPDVYRLIEHLESALDEAEESRVLKAQAEKAAQENAEKEAAEKIAREKAEREIAKKAAQEKADREAAEMAVREKAEHKAAEKTAAEKAVQGKVERETIGKGSQEKDKEHPKSEPIIVKVLRKVKENVRIVAGIGFLVVVIIGLLVLPGVIKPESPVSVPTVTKTATATSAPTDLPKPKNLRVAFVLDTSGVMALRQAFTNMLDVTSSSISEFKENDEVTVYSFNETVTQEIKPTHDFSAAIEKVQSLEAVPNTGACLYDAIYEVFQQVTDFDSTDWIVVVIADGRDHNLQGEICSKVKADIVVNMEQDSIPVYITALGNYYIQDDILGAISSLTKGSYTRTDSSLLEALLLDLFVNLRVGPAFFTPAATPTPRVKGPTDEFGVEIVQIPAGEFTMGSESGGNDEQPVHTVYLDAFSIDKFEITNALYKACVDDGGCNPPKLLGSFTRSNYYGNPDFDDYPVINVDWYMAEAYCEWRGATLPTEAQWEKAARGADERIYPWGNDFDCHNGNFDDELQMDEIVVEGGPNCDGYVDPAPVGSYESGVSPYGVYDLAGNVWEWVADWYSDSYYQDSPDSDPLGPETGQYRAVRGGSWYSLENPLRSPHRFRYIQTAANHFLGFRCARNATP